MGGMTMEEIAAVFERVQAIADGRLKEELDEKMKNEMRLVELTCKDMDRVTFEYMGEVPKEIPLHVDRLIAAYCGDYERRAELIAQNEAQRNLPARIRVHRKKTEKGEKPTREREKTYRSARGLIQAHEHRRQTRMSYHFRRRRALPATLIEHYKDINARIDVALACTVGGGEYAETMRREIGARTGHRKTELYYVDPKTYVVQKKQAKLAIAAALGIL